MASRRQHFAREDFDEAKLTIADPYASQYIATIIDHTVRHDPGSRWSASQVIEQIHWALAKLAEQSEVRDAGSIVLVDNFGPNNTGNESNSRSAKTGHGDPPADYELAQSFFVREAAVLDRVDIGLALRGGSGQVAVTLIKGGFEVPSNSPEDVAESWRSHVGASPNKLRVRSFNSESGIDLDSQEVYWIKLSATGPNSNVAWISAPIELDPQVTRMADRPIPNEWTPRVSPRGPGLALRVIAHAKPDK